MKDITKQLFGIEYDPTLEMEQEASEPLTLEAFDRMAGVLLNQTRTTYTPEQVERLTDPEAR